MSYRKSVFTLTEIVLLSIVWSSTSFVWSNVIRQGLTFVYGNLGTSKYATDILVGMTLLVLMFGMVLLFENVDIGKSSVFQLIDVPKPNNSTEEAVTPPVWSLVRDG